MLMIGNINDGISIFLVIILVITVIYILNKIVMLLKEISRSRNARNDIDSSQNNNSNFVVINRRI